MDDAHGGGAGMTELAHRKKKPYTTVSREAAQDARLSFAARGLLVYLLSQSATWKVNVPAMRRLNNAADRDDPRTSNNEGREAIEKALRTLRRYGYYRVITYKKPDGSFANKGWISEEAVQEWADEYALHSERPPFIAGYDGSDEQDEPPTLTANPQVSRTPGKPWVRDDEGARTYGFPAAGEPEAGNPGFIEEPQEKEDSLRSSSSSRDRDSVDGSLRSPSTAATPEAPPADKTKPRRPRRAPKDRPEQIAWQWIDRRTAMLGLEILPDEGRVMMALPKIIAKELDAGVTENEVKQMLDLVGENLPSASRWGRAREQVRTGRAATAGGWRPQQVHHDHDTGITTQDLFGTEGAA